MTKNRASRKKFAEQTLANSLSSKEKESQHVQMLIAQYVEGEIPVEDIYKQLREES